MSQFVVWSAASAAIGLAVAIILAVKIKKIKVSDAKAEQISQYIHDGSMTFLNKQYQILGVFIAVVGLLIAFVPGLSWQTAILFVFGAVISIASGNIGMRIATAANAKTAEAVKKDIRSGLHTAFFAGSVAGLSVVSLGLLGVLVAFQFFFDANDPESLFGFA